jgi:hypothetical protein
MDVVSEFGSVHLIGIELSLAEYVDFIASKLTFDLIVVVILEIMGGLIP